MSKKKETAKSEDAEEAKPAAGGEGEVIEGDAAPKKGKKKLIIIAAAVVVLLIGVGAFFALSGGDKDAKKDEAAGEHGEAAAGGEHGAAPVATGPVYYELPQFLVNLNAASGRVSFLKMAVTLELRDQAAVAVLDAHKPRIVDTFNTYLRELRPADIQGSAGIYRLRNELLTRLNSTLEEAPVKDVLFGEIIVQ